MSAPPPPTAPPPPANAGANGGAYGQPPNPRRLTRRRRGRLIGGVAVGLARYLGIDPVVVRIGFVILAFVPFPGFGLLVYLAMMLLVPLQDHDNVVLPSRITARSPSFWVGIGLIGVAAVTLLGVWGDGRFGRLVPLLLIGLGIALWVDADRRPGAGEPAVGEPVWARGSGPASTAPWSAPAATTPAATTPVATASDASGAGPSVPGASVPAASGSDVDDVAGQAPPDPPAPPAPPAWPPTAEPTGSGPAWTPPPATRRAASPLGRITMGVAFLAVGVAWLGDLIDLWDVSIAAMSAIALLVLGLGLVVGSVFGRARWLAWIVALVLPFTLLSTLLVDLGIDLTAGFDDRRIEAAELVGLEEPIVIGAGDLVVDLAALERGDDVTLDATLGAGQISVYVPDGVGVTGDVRAEVGSLDLFGNVSGGVSLERTLSTSADPGRPTVTVDLRIGAGEIRFVETAPEVTP